MLANMASGRSSPAGLNAYLGHLIDTEIKAGRTATDIANKAGISVAHVSTIRSGQRGAGWKSVMGLAKAFGKTLAEVEDEAAAWVSKNPVAGTSVEKPDRYQNRVAAINFARAIGIDEAAIAQVGTYDLKDEGDPSPEAWLDWIKGVAAGMRYGRAPVEHDVDETETRPTLPKRRK